MLSTPGENARRGDARHRRRRGRHGDDGENRRYFCSFSPAATFETYFQQRVRGSFHFPIALAVFYTALVMCLSFLPQVGREIENWESRSDPPPPPPPTPAHARFFPPWSLITLLLLSPQFITGIDTWGEAEEAPDEQQGKSVRSARV